MTARIAVATALSRATSSSVVRALNGCLVRDLICVPSSGSSTFGPCDAAKRKQGDLHIKAARALLLAAFIDGYLFLGPPLHTNTQPAQRFHTAGNINTSLH